MVLPEDFLVYICDVLNCDFRTLQREMRGRDSHGAAFRQADVNPSGAARFARAFYGAGNLLCLEERIFAQQSHSETAALIGE